MEGLRILIVDDQDSLRQSMAETLAAEENIKTVDEAANGAEALRMLSEHGYDIMITDIVMPVMDGYMLMEEMRRLALSPLPKVIVATALARDDFVIRAVELGAVFYMIKPFEPENLIGHIREMSGERKISSPVLSGGDVPKTQGLDERLSSLFLTVGIPAHIKGYQYLRAGIKLVVENPDLINRITKGLYPSIAAQYGTSASKVERAIRHAIEVAWNRGRIENINRVFGCRVCSPEDKPTNGEFIAMIAEKLLMEMSA